MNESDYRCAVVRHGCHSYNHKPTPLGPITININYFFINFATVIRVFKLSSPVMYTPPSK